MRLYFWLDFNLYPKMYQDTMEDIHGSLIQKGFKRGLTHIMELIPSRQSDGQMYAFLFHSLKCLTNN